MSNQDSFVAVNVCPSVKLLKTFDLTLQWVEQREEEAYDILDAAFLETGSE